MRREVMWTFDGRTWKSIVVFRNKTFLNNKYIMATNEKKHMHGCAVNDKKQDELYAEWFTAVRAGLVDDLKALAVRGCNPFITCGHQTARTMVKNWTTRLKRMESEESERSQLFKAMHSVLYQAELNWITHKKLKQSLRKWRKEYDTVEE